MKNFEFFFSNLKKVKPVRFELKFFLKNLKQKRNETILENNI